MQPLSLIHCVTDATEDRYQRVPGERTDNSGIQKKGGVMGCTGLVDGTIPVPINHNPCKMFESDLFFPTLQCLLRTSHIGMEIL